MLMLLFHLDRERYALESKQVIEIVPLVELRKQPHAPTYMAGVFNYRGQIIPVVDLCQLIQERPCQAHLSTRIILVNPPLTSHQTNGGSTEACNGKELIQLERSTSQFSILGLMAERVVEMIDISETALVNAGASVETAPYLGKMILDEQGMIQCLRIENLFTEEQRSRLFATYDAVSS